MMRISGIAIIEDTYLSEGGVNVGIRESDLSKLTLGENPKPIVVDHDESSFGFDKGKLTFIEGRPEGLYYEAIVDDSVLEEQILKLYQVGKTPNVSLMMMPACDSITKVVSDEFGDTFYADTWDIQHLSIVKLGRCNDEMGCGVHNVEVITEDDLDLSLVNEGDETLTEDVNAELEALKLELSELKAKHESVESEYKEMELVLKETEANLEIMRKQEFDETKALVLQAAPNADLSGMKTKEELMVVLSAIEDAVPKMTKVVDVDVPELSPAQLKLQELKAKRNEQYGLKF